MFSKNSCLLLHHLSSPLVLWNILWSFKLRRLCLPNTLICMPFHCFMSSSSLNGCLLSPSHRMLRLNEETAIIFRSNDPFLCTSLHLLLFSDSLLLVLWKRVLRKSEQMFSAPQKKDVMWNRTAIQSLLCWPDVHQISVIACLSFHMSIHVWTEKRVLRSDFPQKGSVGLWFDQRQSVTDACSCTHRVPQKTHRKEWESIEAKTKDV